MSMKILMVIITVIGLGGCAGLTQFPESTKDYATTLNDQDADYAATLALIKGKNPAEQKQIRKEMMERRMAVIDAYFKEFQAGLVKENVRAEFGVALLGVGVGAAGSLVTETASQILSAVSGGLAGAQAAYGKAALYEKAMSALVAQMQAGRKTVAARIYERWNLDLDTYPLWMARMDLDAYTFAGSLPGAILGTAADAKVKEAAAEVILMRPITEGSLTPEMFNQREKLEEQIDTLSGDKAKALIVKIETEFKETRAFIERQYPGSVSTADANGNKAKSLLKRLVSNTVRGPKDEETWRNAIDGL